VRLAVPGATVNDVVVSIAAGAVRRYLKSKRETDRSAAARGHADHTRTQQEFGDAGNSISAMFCEAHVDVAAPLERLAAIRRSTSDAKESSGAVGAREMNRRHPPQPDRAHLRRREDHQRAQLGGCGGRTLRQLCVSNVPGPTVPLYMCGAEMKFWNIVAPLPQAIGLFFGVSSYRGTLFIAPTADRRMMPDPEFFERCLDRSMAEHVAAAERRLLEAPGAARGFEENAPRPPAEPGPARDAGPPRRCERR